MTEAQAVTVELRRDDIAVITLDVPGESQNTLKRATIERIAAIVDELEQQESLRGVVIRSGKPGSFIAGADINMIRDCPDAASTSELARGGQQFFGRIEDFRVPVVAAIDGVCLGGGLELALACHARVCSDAKATKLGLPEVMLGLLPGSGGTQRLPRLVGIPAALDMMLTGRQVRADKARRLKLVDEVVPASILLTAAVRLVERLNRESPNEWRTPKAFSAAGLTRLLIDGNPLGRRYACSKARQQIAAKTHGNYPAPTRIIDCVEAGFRYGFRRGLEIEARHFGELSQTPEARELIRIYFATTAMKKDRGIADENVQTPQICKIGVLGAGLMGAGIALVSTDQAGTPVRLKDRDTDSLNRGMQYIVQRLNEKRKRRSLSAYEADIRRHRITPTLDYSGFGTLDLVIEAVFEDLDLKQTTVREVEAAGPDRLIFASNTSSLPIAEIAAAAQRPERVVGMHYFSPVERMPLLEVIATEHTAAEVIAGVVAFGRKQGKTVIVVKDGAGFYVNRILAPYINEATRLLGSGIAIDKIDHALVQFGFPVGPFKLLDEVGLDVSAKVGPVIYQAFGERMRPSEIAEKMLADGRVGKKGKQGFYRYGIGKKSGKQVDETVYEVLGIKARLPMDDAEIVDRCVLPLINEAVRCWQEGVIRSLRDGDIGTVFGIGFPPFRGGPFRYCDRRGAAEIVAKLESYQKQYGERFEPAPLLRELAVGKQSFYSEE